MDPLVHVPTLPGSPFRVPPQLEGLRRLAYNLWWTWHPEAKILFSRVDGPAWGRYRNPVPVLAGSVAWGDVLDSPAFMAEYQGVIGAFDKYMSNGADHWFHRRHADALKGPIAYFCAEYGFHESLGIYSGGLGVLAGDHMKSASDMALPLVGVGLMYRKGYFRQSIDADGHQEHAYPDFDLTRLPILRVADPSGDPLQVSVELPGRSLAIAVWLVQVGRVPVLLLDTDLPENDDADRPISHILYVRGREMRLHQELVLGVGGTRAIRALGIAPGGLAPQRGPLGVPPRRACPGARDRRLGPGRRARQGEARQRVHDPHARLGRQRAVRGRPGPPGGGSAASTATAGRAPAACRSTGSSRSAGAWTATTCSST